MNKALGALSLLSFRHHLLLPSKFPRYLNINFTMASLEFKKILISAGNKVDFPAIGAMIEMHYTGCLYDSDAPNNMGTK